MFLAIRPPRRSPLFPYTTLFRSLKVAFAGQAAHAHDPVRVLTGLNGALCGKFEEHFVTAAYLFVDLEKSLLHYCAAGHPPRLCWPPAPRVKQGKLKRTA